MPNFTTDLQGLAERLSLKKMGSEYHGPCVVCGGTDRFFATRGKVHPIVVACRQGCDFADIARELTQMGLLAKDADYERPQYRESDIEHARWLIAIGRATLANNQPVSPSDIKSLLSASKKVPENMSNELKRIAKEVING
jgi:hypothetical protein